MPTEFRGPKKHQKVEELVQPDDSGMEAARAWKAAERWPESWNMKKVQWHNTWKGRKMGFQVRAQWEPEYRDTTEHNGAMTKISKDLTQFFSWRRVKQKNLYV